MWGCRDESRASIEQHTALEEKLVCTWFPTSVLSAMGPWRQKPLKSKSEEWERLFRRDNDQVDFEIKSRHYLSE